MSDVTRAGVQGARPGRDAQPPQRWQRGRGRGRGRGERAMVPDADFQSYYGKAVLNPPVWEATDIAGYLFLGGLAAGSSLLGAGADLTDRPALRKVGRLTALGAISVSFAALVHDLGKPGRFVNMLRVAKPTSPMSVGTWILTAFGPAAGVAAMSEYADRFPRLLGAPLRLLGRPAGLASAAVAPAVGTYTAVLIADTAVPAWHEAHAQLPIVFAGSALSAAAGMGMLAAPVDEAGPARRLGVAASLGELAASEVMQRRMGLSAQAFATGRAHTLHRLARGLTLGGAVVGGLLGRRSRLASAAAGAALLGGSAALRFSIFEAGMVSAKDPKYTVVPQRERADARR